MAKKIERPRREPDWDGEADCSCEEHDESYKDNVEIIVAYQENDADSEEGAKENDTKEDVEQ